MSNVIRLVTTEGCQGCIIAINLIAKAIKKSHYKDIDFQIIDCLNEEYRQFINRYFITDYPTMVFIKDDKVLVKYEGTKPVRFIIDEINKQFS